jgi:hypothetical protein
MTRATKTKSAFYAHCHRCQECESFCGEQTWGRCRFSGVTVKASTKGRRCHSQERGK